MIAADSAEGRAVAFWAFLLRELAPRPGRMAAVARIATCCTIVVFTTMLYKIPEPAYAAYIVFFLGRGDTVVTLETGIAGGIASTLATLLTLILYMLDASEPALRLPLMAGSTFLGMFILRTMETGPITFYASFVMVVTQSIIDDFPSLEALTRFVLWLWVVVLLPDVVTVLINLLTSPQPALLARQQALTLMEAVSAVLRCGEPLDLTRESAEILDLVDLRQRAGLLDRSLRANAAIDNSLIEAVEELVSQAMMLPPDTTLEVRMDLAAACDTCREAFSRGVEPGTSAEEHVAAIDIASLTPAVRPVVVAMRHTLERFSTGLTERRVHRSETLAKHVRSAFAADAFSNPDHARFALKTTIAAMAAYITYTGLDWSGIRTSLITCFFVALGTLGETMHRLTLRLSGAAIGGLIGGLCIVYVLPTMTDIGDLCLLIAGVSAVCAWVATSSELLAYAGMQMALAFYLGVLQAYEPSTDLTVLRDRMVGILLGNVLMSVVFSMFWPVTAVGQARNGLAAAFRSLAIVVRDTVPSPGFANRMDVARAIVMARKLMGLAVFETLMLPEAPTRRPIGHALLADLGKIVGAVFVVVEQGSGEAVDEVLRKHDAAVATWFEECADALRAARPLPSPPASQTLDLALSALPEDARAETRAAIEARLLLLSNMCSVGSHAVY
jgi:multidrug resistance protein MdtO